MSKKAFRAEYDVDGQHVSIGVPVYLWEEEGIWYALAPALDMTGYGKSEQEAKRSFEVMMEEFVAYTHRKKTIFQVLENLGWTTNKKKKRVAAPQLEDLIKENEDVKAAVERPGVKVWNRKLELAL